MADEQTGTQAGTQPGQAVPQPADVIRPPSTAAQTAPKVVAPDDPRQQIAALRAEADRLEETLPKTPGTVRVKVMPPHAEFHFGGVVVGSEFTPVNELQLSSLQQAASRSGVELATE